jgi:diguanylate cyclase (GGDEF)-like protein
MIEASELLRSYIRILRRLSAADSVSLFVPASAGGSAPAMLIHDGDGPAVPELADLAAAARLDAASATEVHPSSDPRGALISLPSARLPWAGGDDVAPDRGHRRRRRGDPATAHRRPPAAWLGVRFPAGSVVAERLPPKAPPEGGAEWWWTWLLALGGELAGHAVQVSVVLRDPVTGVPGRAAFQGVLGEELEKARRHGRPLGLLLVNPDDFAAVNQRFGRDAGDEIIRELVGRLRAALRSADLVAKYGGVVYGAVLLDTPVAMAQDVAAKVLQSLAEPAYRGGTIPLRVSVGVAAFEAGDGSVRQPLDLIRRADQALNVAKRAGGARVAVWDAAWPRDDLGQVDPMTGLFTGDMASDYRNMVLLWDAVSVMAASDDFETIARHVVERLFTAFDPDRVALLVREGGASSLVIGLGRATPAGATPLSRLDLNDAQQAFMAQAARERLRVSTSVYVGPGPLRPDETHGYYVPLVAHEEPLGGLYLERPAGLGSADIIFLEALAAQLAVALDRARSAQHRRAQQEAEQKRLRAALDDLRQALQRSKLEYRSAEMEEVLKMARRVAPTDATVLIMGESGTGKELLARMVHELSPRRHRPMVVVDCSAIAPSLADSELFGRERGAYTGAQEGREGRLAEAHGGTLLLDEIGELPLEVQGKLLRFVQEKQVVAVGGTRLRGLDVRIVAATNRQLAREVAEGRFREDLYHRLNVVKLVVPPLRERRDDILHLAAHFIATYGALYHKAVRRLAPEAEALLVAHAWPGNVRELQNRIMQAVILCEGEELGLEELALREADGPRLPSETGGPAGAATTPVRPADRSATRGASRPSDEGASWDRLASSLARQVDLALAGPTPRPMPFGRWLVADAALEASRVASGVARRAAARLGVPETTFRRVLRRASDEAASGLASRSESWDDVRRALRDVLDTSASATEDRIERLERLLLEKVRERTTDERLGAALLGVSLPTFRLRATALRRERPAS